MILDKAYVENTLKKSVKLVTANPNKPHEVDIEETLPVANPVPFLSLAHYVGNEWKVYSGSNWKLAPSLSIFRFVFDTAEFRADLNIDAEQECYETAAEFGNATFTRDDVHNGVLPKGEDNLLPIFMKLHDVVVDGAGSDTFAKTTTTTTTTTTRRNILEERKEDQPETRINALAVDYLNLNGLNVYPFKFTGMRPYFHLFNCVVVSDSDVYVCWAPNGILCMIFEAKTRDNLKPGDVLAQMATEMVAAVSHSYRHINKRSDKLPVSLEVFCLRFIETCVTFARSRISLEQLEALNEGSCPKPKIQLVICPEETIPVTYNTPFGWDLCDPGGRSQAIVHTQAIRNYIQLQLDVGGHRDADQFKVWAQKHKTEKAVKQGGSKKRSRGVDVTSADMSKMVV